MKKLLIFLLLLVTFLTRAQSIETDSKGSKIAQGAFTGTALFLVANTVQQGENRWLSYFISIAGAMALESTLNTNLRSSSYVLGGAIAVNLSFEIFKPKRRKCLN